MSGTDRNRPQSQNGFSLLGHTHHFDQQRTEQVLNDQTGTHFSIGGFVKDPFQQVAEDLAIVVADLIEGEPFQQARHEFAAHRQIADVKVNEVGFHFFLRIGLR